MVDWQEIVRRIGRSRTDFTLVTWDEPFITDTKIIRLVCNCCGAWAQQALTYEMLVNAYYPDLIFADTIEQLVRFMLEVNTDGTKVYLSRGRPNTKETPMLISRS